MESFKTGVAGIVVKNKTYTINKIIDNENLTVKENPEEVAGEILKGEHDFFYIPKIDNSTLFKEVYSRLADDGCICIFPEGTSHDRTDFIKLKAGVALMALGALADGKCENVNILPVGLNYFNRDK